MSPDRTSSPSDRLTTRDPRGFSPARQSAFAPLPRRVLMATESSGEVWTYSIELARALADHEIEVALATVGEPLSKAQWSEVEELSNAGVFASTFRLEWMDNPWEDVQRSGEWLLELEHLLRPDLVHLNNYSHGVLPFRAPKLVVGHSCVMAWWRSVKGEPAPPDWDRYREAVRDGLRNANHVVAPTRTMLRELQHDYGPLERADVIYHGRQLHYSNAPAVRLPAKEAIVFSTGRAWDQAKNMESLAAAANQLPWKVAVAADAADSGEHTRPMDNVYWLGELSSEELLPWFARASIYALPARYEPFGLPVVEAALSRCALVLGNIASLREIWGDAALFVDPDDPEALRHSIEKLIEDEDLRRDLASRAHTRALELSPANMAAAYLAVYSELIRNRQTEPELICVS